MRFRPKIGTPSPWQVLTALTFWFVYLVFQLAHPNNLEKPIFEAISVFTLLALVAVFLAIRSVYWDFTPECLVVRRLWTKREVAYSEVRRVGWLGSMSGTFSISIGHLIENYDRLYIEPGDQAGFVAALRKYAPQADFELD